MSKETEEQFEEENDGLIELVDEDGKVINFTLACRTQRRNCGRRGCYIPLY